MLEPSEEPPAPDVSKLSIPGNSHDLDALSSHVNKELRPMIDQIDALRALGIEKDIAIPQIAVMGDQSSGKSSVLEAISGIQFPRGTGLVTKCATELRMKKAKGKGVWRATVKLSWNKPQPDTIAGNVSTPEELGRKIEQLTEYLLAARGNNASFEPEHSIVINLESDTCSDLTLIDLPGIVRTSVAGQEKEVIAQVNSLLQHYLKQERTVILAVIPSNVDIATVDIIERAFEADNEGKRTVGVLTKPDLIGDGSHGHVVETLRNQLKPLKLGYVMVKNRSQKDIDNRVPLQDIRAAELRWFDEHQDLGPIFREKANLFGCEQLIIKLTDILTSRIEESLPDMMKEIRDQIEKTHTSLRMLGDAFPDNNDDKKFLFVNLVQAIGRDLAAALDGHYGQSMVSAQIFYEIFSQTPNAPVLKAFQDDQEARIISNIKTDILPKFRENIHERLNNPEWDLCEVKRQISEMQGRELPGFPNYSAFVVLLRERLKTWREPLMEMLEKTVVAVKKGGKSIIHCHCSKSQKLEVKIGQVFLQLVKVRSETARTQDLERLLDQENNPSTLNHYHMDTFNKIQSKAFEKTLDDILDTSMEQVVETNKDAFTSTLKNCSTVAYNMAIQRTHALQTVVDESTLHSMQQMVETNKEISANMKRAIRSRMMEWHEQEHSVGKSNAEQEAVMMISLLDAYGKTSVKRFIDNGDQVTDRVVLQGLAADFIKKCVQLSSSPEIFEAMQENEETKTKRSQLLGKLDRLVRAQELLNRSA